MAEIVDFGLQQHKIKMDSRYFENVLSVVAGDTGRRIEVQLLDTNGMVQDTTGLNLRLNAVIAGKATYTDATLVDAATGKYQLDLSNGMFLAPGNWEFQWQITDSAGKKLHSFAFTGNVGSNISEGSSQATNFYLNLEDLKAMQEDLVNGTFNSEALETNIAGKLTDLETQYAPKLTEVTAQLDHNENVLKQTSNPLISDGAVICFVDDDGFKSFDTNLKPWFTNKGVQASLAVITDRIDSGRTDVYNVEELKQLESEGYDIISHSTNHDARIFRDEEGTDEEIEAAFRDSHAWMKYKGFKGADILAYPWGTFSEPLRFKKIARKYYRYALTSGSGYNNTPFDNMFVVRQPLDKRNDFNTTYKPIIDECIANKGLLIFLTHADNTAQIDGAYLNTTINYIQSQNVPIMTMSEALKYKGNALSVGEFTDTNRFYLSNDGVVLSNIIPETEPVNIGVKYLQGLTAQHGKTLSSPITDFDVETTTVFRINNVTDDLASEGGTITIQRPNVGGNYGNATFITGLSRRMFINTVDANNVWRTWREVAFV